MALKLEFSFIEGGAVESIIVDATMKETHTSTADITDFPVEVGANVSDNIRKKPNGLQIEALVSDFPLQSAGRAQSPSGAAPGTERPPTQERRSTGVHAKLEQLQNEGRTVTVTTGLKTYKSMGISSVTVNRDKTLKNGLVLSITMKELILLASQTVLVVKVGDPKGMKKTTDGKKTGHEVSANQESLTRQTARAIKNAAVGFFKAVPE